MFITIAALQMRMQENSRKTCHSLEAQIKTSQVIIKQIVIIILRYKTYHHQAPLKQQNILLQITRILKLKIQEAIMVIPHQVSNPIITSNKSIPH